MITERKCLDLKLLKSSRESRLKFTAEEVEEILSCIGDPVRQIRIDKDIFEAVDCERVILLIRKYCSKGNLECMHFGEFSLDAETADDFFPLFRNLKMLTFRNFDLSERLLQIMMNYSKQLIIFRHRMVGVKVAAKPMIVEPVLIKRRKIKRLKTTKMLRK